jgi:hypothetical protein
MDNQPSLLSLTTSMKLTFVGSNPEFFPTSEKFKLFVLLIHSIGSPQAKSSCTRVKMSDHYNWIFLAVVVSSFLIQAIWKSLAPGLRTVPGPFLAKFTPLWLFPMAASGKLHQTMRDLHEKHGHLVRYDTNHISVSDPKEVPTIYGIKTNLMKVKNRFWIHFWLFLTLIFIGQLVRFIYVMTPRGFRGPILRSR